MAGDEVPDPIDTAGGADGVCRGGLLVGAVTRRWPWVADTPLDIARRLLASYRHALQDEAPEKCRLLDEQAAEFGQGWVVPQTERVDVDDLVSAAAAAELIGVTVTVIYTWASRGLLVRRDTAEGTRYRVGDVLDAHAARRRARAQRDR